MAGSQLKRLKASLREQGVIGPQQSKKQKRKNAEDQKSRNDKRLQRSAVLENIREQFNPFQFKTNARGPKFEVTTNRPAGDRASMGINGRPGLSKAIGEERVRDRSSECLYTYADIRAIASRNSPGRNAAP